MNQFNSLKFLIKRNTKLYFKDKLTFKLQRQDNIHPHSIAAPSVVIE